jgi:glutathione S-transferase
MIDDLPVLHQLRFSHYNEKARFALDWKNIPHRRRSYVPGFHVAPVKRLSGQKFLPVLVLHGRATCDSTAIIAALEALRPDVPLYPVDPAERERALDFEDFFDEELGPEIRRAAFAAILGDRRYAVALITMGGGIFVRTLYFASFPTIARTIRGDMSINDETVKRAHRKIRAAMDRIAAEVGRSGYLVGDSFSVADLTGAALLTPLVQPAEFPYRFPEPPTDSLRRFRESFADHEAFAWASEIYRRHRGVSREVIR